jgi:alpha-tubulin suppressor-like RCC1 family protein
VPTLDDNAAGDGFAYVSAGKEHTCAIALDGTAYCWGSNEFGQLGVADDDTRCARGDRHIPCQPRPVAVAGSLKFQKISAGGAHTCALTLDYHIYCWGDNTFGALGDPALSQTFIPSAVASTALYGDVAAGGAHSCGLRADGVAQCWGANENGQLGINSVGTGTAIPANASTGQRFVSISAGDRRTCARTSTGLAYCWGLTFVLQGTTELTRSQQTPQLIAQDTLFQSVGVGTNSTCGITIANRAFCWESNVSGSIGDGTRLGSTKPIEVSTSRDFVAVSSGAAQSCGIADDGLAYCWGADNFGQLGISPSLLNARCGPAAVPCSRLPVRVNGWRVFSQISAGLGDHVCALSFAGSIYCWGAGSMGQRGDGRTSIGEWSPVKTQGIGNRE